MVLWKVLKCFRKSYPQLMGIKREEVVHNWIKMHQIEMLKLGDVAVN